MDLWFGKLGWIFLDRFICIITISFGSGTFIGIGGAGSAGYKSRIDITMGMCGRRPFTFVLTLVSWARYLWEIVGW